MAWLLVLPFGAMDGKARHSLEFFGVQGEYVVPLRQRGSRYDHVIWADASSGGLQQCPDSSMSACNVNIQRYNGNLGKNRFDERRAPSAAFNGIGPFNAEKQLRSCDARDSMPYC